MDALVILGITKRLDLFTGPAVNLGFRQSGIERQWLVEYGFQYKLFERGNWRLLTADGASSPWTNRRTGSHTLFASLSVSKDFRNHKFAVYGGFAPTFTVGNRDDLLFSSKNGSHNVPLGVMIQAGAKLQIFLEIGLRSPIYYSSGLSYNIRPGTVAAPGH